MPPASLVLPAQGPGPVAGEGRDRNRAGRLGEWGRRGRCPDFPFQSRGGERAERPPCLPGDAPRLVLTLALRAGRVPAASPVGPAEGP